MSMIYLLMAACFLLSVFLIGVVAVGMQHKGRDEHPRLALMFRRTARALNGEDDLPRALRLRA
ncbi:hypothetical protein [Granulicoccus phenolivorans]|uniref:hypothetical protein n=1 Tax=Granulicoccus phenolivorans TaxID=266854 RepID=UPI00047D6528|nr:hypothetical protein [Granulicoccus phenolivorans]